MLMFGLKVVLKIGLGWVVGIRPIVGLWDLGLYLACLRGGVFLRDLSCLINCRKVNYHARKLKSLKLKWIRKKIGRAGPGPLFWTGWTRAEILISLSG